MSYRAVALNLSLLIVALLVMVGSAASRSIPASLDSLASIIPDSLQVAGKVVYVDFWASWCQPCRKSFPFMERLYAVHKSDGLEIIAVNLDKDSTAAAAFLATNRSTVNIAYDTKGRVAKRFNLKAIPTSFIYGRDGTLRDTHQGFETADTTDLISLVGNLLNEKAKK